MARLNTTSITFEISKLQRNNEENEELLSPEAREQLVEIVAQLAADGVLVEVETDDE